MLKLLRASRLSPSQLLDALQLPHSQPQDLSSEDLDLAGLLLSEAEAPAILRFLEEELLAYSRKNGSEPRIFRLILDCLSFVPQEGRKLVEDSCLSWLSESIEEMEAGSEPNLTFHAWWLIAELLLRSSPKAAFRREVSERVSGLIKRVVEKRCRERVLADFFSSRCFPTLLERDESFQLELFGFVQRFWEAEFPATLPLWQEPEVAPPPGNLKSSDLLRTDLPVALYQLVMECYSRWSSHRSLLENSEFDSLILELSLRGIYSRDTAVRRLGLAILQQRCIHAHSSARSGLSRRDHWSAKQWSDFMILSDRAFQGQPHLLAEVWPRFLDSELCSRLEMLPFICAILVHTLDLPSTTWRQNVARDFMRALVEAPASSCLNSEDGDDRGFLSFCLGPLLHILTYVPFFKKNRIHADGSPALPLFEDVLSEFLVNLIDQRIRVTHSREQMIAAVFRLSGLAASPVVQLVGYLFVLGSPGEI